MEGLSQTIHACPQASLGGRARSWLSARDGGTEDKGHLELVGSWAQVIKKGNGPFVGECVRDPALLSVCSSENAGIK